MKDYTPSTGQSKVTTLPNARQLLEAYKTKQGLGQDDADALGMKLVEPGTELALALQRILGYSIKIPCATITCPSWPENYLRLRKLGPIAKGDGKYLSPKKSRHGHPYLTPGLDWNSIKADPTKPVAIAEGEITAYWGCKMGGTVVGIPGVDMETPLFDGSWEWHGRTVSVTFDHDEGYPAGTYKPEVTRALGKLCYKLLSAGADVVVLDIGKVCSDPSQKWGLDDYLRAGGTWEALIGTAHEPPEWCEHLTYFNENCVVVSGDKPHIWNKLDGSRMAISAFHQFYTKWTRIDRTNPERPRIVRTSNTWTDSPSRPEAVGYVYDPSGEFGHDPKTKLINMWEGYPDHSDKGEWDWSQELESCRSAVLELDYLLQRHFGPHKDLFCCWIGHMLTKPWEPTTLHFFNRSPLKGNGKSLIGLIVRRLTGPVAGREVDPDLEMEPFSVTGKDKSIFEDWPEVKLRNVSAGRIRNMLTAEKISIHPKGLTAFSITNLKRHYFSSNVDAPMEIDADERRLVAVEPDIRVAEFKEEFADWVHWFAAFALNDPDFLGDAWRYFTEYAGVESFDPLQRAPQTEALLGMAMASKSSTRNAVDILVERVNADVPDWFAIGGVLRGKNKLGQAIRNALRPHGWDHATKKVAMANGIKVDALVFAKADFRLRWEKDKQYHITCTDPRLEIDASGINPVAESMKSWDSQFNGLFADWEGK